MEPEARIAASPQDPGPLPSSPFCSSRWLLLSPLESDIFAFLVLLDSSYYSGTYDPDHSSQKIIFSCDLSQIP